MKKILSIVIAAYNVEAYLESTLRSCVLEDREIQAAYEVLVVNDGSTDGTARIAREFMTEYPEIFRIIDKSNGGYGSVINEGVKVAEGKYFKLLDGDDWYDAQALAELLGYLRTCNSGMVLTDYVKVHEDSGKRDVLSYNGLRQREELPASELQGLTGGLAMHSICYRTDVLRSLPVPVTEHCFYTDNEYAIYGASYVKSFVYYPLCLYQYRVGREGQSMSISGILKHIGDMEKVIAALEAFYEQLGEGENRELASHQIALAYRGYLTHLLLLPYSRERLQRIKAFDLRVKEQYPQRYQWMENRKLHILRMTGYRAYGLCRLYCRWEKARDER